MPPFDASLTGALRLLSAQYARAVDQRSFDDLREVFVEGGQLVVDAGTRNGIDAIIKTMESLRRYEVTFHQLGQVLILDQGVDPSGLWAESETYCTAHHISESDGLRTDHVMFIRYQDRSVNHGDGWRLARRQLQVSFVDDRLLTALPPPSRDDE